MSAVCRWCKGTKHVQLLTSVAPCLECADTAEAPTSGLTPTGALKRWLADNIGEPHLSGNCVVWELPSNEHTCKLGIDFYHGCEWSAEALAQAIRLISQNKQIPESDITDAIVRLVSPS